MSDIQYQDKNKINKIDECYSIKCAIKLTAAEENTGTNLNKRTA